jgi:hypothetical protein
MIVNILLTFPPIMDRIPGELWNDIYGYFPFFTKWIVRDFFPEKDLMKISARNKENIVMDYIDSRQFRFENMMEYIQYFRLDAGYYYYKGESLLFQVAAKITSKNNKENILKCIAANLNSGLAYYYGAVMNNNIELVEWLSRDDRISIKENERKEDERCLRIKSERIFSIAVKNRNVEMCRLLYRLKFNIGEYAFISFKYDRENKKNYPALWEFMETLQCS